jgi:hypothetical protein
MNEKQGRSSLALGARALQPSARRAATASSAHQRGGELVESRAPPGGAVTAARVELRRAETAVSPPLRSPTFPPKVEM